MKKQMLILLVSDIVVIFCSRFPTVIILRSVFPTDSDVKSSMYELYANSLM